MTQTESVPVPSNNTLLLIALRSEAQVSEGDPPDSKGILPIDATPFWTNEWSPDTAPQEAYRFDNLTIGLTGPQAHSLASVGTKLMLDNARQGGSPFERIVNFGAVGAYPWSPQTSISDAYFVSLSRRWDQTIPARGFEFYTDAIRLAVPSLPPGEVAKTCLSGSRFSSDFDHQSREMLDGDLEDLELYDMARIANTIEIPFYSIKFVTNTTTPDGASKFFENLAKARTQGTEKLESFLLS